uniref:KH domain-containing protein n=1 Tax=Globodera pallida TaxID=36090 RepID=A0A183C1K0_GLOPA
MSYYPGLAESPPPPAVSSFCAKGEPLDSEFDRAEGWKRPLAPNVATDSWASMSGTNTGGFFVNAPFGDVGVDRGDAPASAGVYHHQSPATTANTSQTLYTHNNAYFSEEFQGHHPNISSVGGFSSEFRSNSQLPLVKSRFDGVEEERQQPEFRQRRIYGDNGGGDEVQRRDNVTFFSAQSATMAPAQTHCQQQNFDKGEEQLNKEFYTRPTTTSSSSVAKKRTFTEIEGFDPLTTAAPIEAKVPRIVLISYPAAPPAVLKGYADDRRKSFHNFQPNERQSPLEVEYQHSLLDLRQELALIDSLDSSVTNCLKNSRRLLIDESTKLEEWHDPDWVEVDVTRPIKLSKQVLIPTFRFPTFNFVGRIVGYKGSTVTRISRKYKCFISILGAHSTKDRQQEVELLQSGDYRYAHYASPLHVRVDVIAPTHLAHMRMAAVLNFFHKLFVPNRDFDVDAELADVDLMSDSNGASKSKRDEGAASVAINRSKAGRRRIGKCSFNSFISEFVGFIVFRFSWRSRRRCRTCEGKWFCSAWNAPETGQRNKWVIDQKQSRKKYDDWGNESTDKQK